MYSTGGHFANSIIIPVYNVWYPSVQRMFSTGGHFANSIISQCITYDIPVENICFVLVVIHEQYNIPVYNVCFLLVVIREQYNILVYNVCFILAIIRLRRTFYTDGHKTCILLSCDITIFCKYYLQYFFMWYFCAYTAV